MIAGAPAPEHPSLVKTEDIMNVCGTVLVSRESQTKTSSRSGGKNGGHGVCVQLVASLDSEKAQMLSTQRKNSSL